MPRSFSSTSLSSTHSLHGFIERFKRSCDRPSFRNKISFYENAVHLLAHAHMFQSIEDILEHQKKYKDASKEGFVTRIISLYGKSRMLNHALRTFDEMPQLNCNPTVKSFNALLIACINSKNFSKMLEIFREIPAKFLIRPDLYSYNILIKGLCDMGYPGPSIALRMKNEMENCGLTPNLVTFNTLLHEFYKNGRFSVAEKIWAQMESRGVVPNIRSYNAKLWGLGSEKRTVEAVCLVEEMEGIGVRADVASFNALIRGYCVEGKLREARQWYEKMVSNGLCPNTVTFSVLIPVAWKEREVELIMMLCEDAFVDSSVVCCRLLQSVVAGLVKMEKIDEISALVNICK